MFRLTKSVYGGGEIIYDDLAKSLILSKYGLFWKYNPDFNLGLEYSQIGDKKTINGTVFHKASGTTQVGSAFIYDIEHKCVGVTTAVRK